MWRAQDGALLQPCRKCNEINPASAAEGLTADVFRDSSGNARPTFITPRRKTRAFERVFRLSLIAQGHALQLERLYLLRKTFALNGQPFFL